MLKVDSINIFLLATLALVNHPVVCRDIPPEPTVKEFQNQINDDGSYNFRYVLSDGTERDETGFPVLGGTLFVSGYFTYIDPNGKKQNVVYYADKTGYHPKLGKPTTGVTSSVEYTGVLSPGIVASLLG